MRKIAMFMGEYGEYQTELSNAIIRNAVKNGNVLHVFSNSG